MSRFAIVAVLMAVLSAAVSALASNGGPPRPRPACDNFELVDEGKCADGMNPTICKATLDDGQPTCPSTPVIAMKIYFNEKRKCEGDPDNPGPASDTACLSAWQKCMERVFCSGPPTYTEVDGVVVVGCTTTSYSGSSPTFGNRGVQSEDCESSSPNL